MHRVLSIGLVILIATKYENTHKTFLIIRITELLFQISVSAPCNLADKGKMGRQPQIGHKKYGEAVAAENY